jgi:hypothetical protein
MPGLRNDCKYKISIFIQLKYVVKPKMNIIGYFIGYGVSKFDFTFIRHNQSMSRALARHRVLIKTERAEAEVILEDFLKILTQGSLEI